MNKLIQQKENHERELAKLSAAMQTLRQKLVIINRLIMLEGGNDFGKRNNRKEVVEAARQALRNLGQPSHYAEIAAQMERDGFYLAGKTPAVNLLSLIYRDPHFRRTKKEGIYELAESREPA